jgi:DNA invertase Pin-like site-specific DNA recombinase
VAYLCVPYRPADASPTAGEQEAALRRTCEGHGWKFEGTLIDSVAPGRNQRPSLHRLMDVACRKPKPFDAVFVAEPDQLSDDPAELLAIDAELDALGIELMFGTGDIPDEIGIARKLRARARPAGAPQAV